MAAGQQSSVFVPRVVSARCSSPVLANPYETLLIFRQSIQFIRWLLSARLYREISLPRRYNRFGRISVLDDEITGIAPLEHI